ncbi:hypothetical protein V1504DRAFT_445015 [Lipomyces starkeyi]
MARAARDFLPLPDLVGLRRHRMNGETMRLLTLLPGYSGLKKHVKDEIGKVGKPTGLNDLYELALRIDSLYVERELEKRFDERNNGNSNRRFRYAMSPTNNENAAISSSNQGPEPMQIRVQITCQIKMCIY